MRTNISSLKNWCDNVGGQWKTEVTEGGFNPETRETNRCVLNNEGEERWNSEREEFITNDIEFVEIDDRGFFRAQTRDGNDQTITITYKEWENHPEKGQQDYSEREVTSYVIDGLESISSFDNLDARYFGTNIGETENGDPIGLERRVEVEVNKSPHEVSEQLTTQEDMKLHYQAMEVERWLMDARKDAQEGEIPDGWVPLSSRSPEEWIEQRGDDSFKEELEEIRQIAEENRKPEHDPFPCPDDGTLGEAEFNNTEVEGEIDRIDCSENETVVGMEGGDGSFYVFEGSPDGSKPKRMKVDGRDAPYDDFDFKTHRATSERRSF